MAEEMAGNSSPSASFVKEVTTKEREDLDYHFTTNGKQFKWDGTEEELLRWLKTDDEFPEWILAKQDEKIAILKGTNVTINWYKSTKTVHIQGTNEQALKKRLSDKIPTTQADKSIREIGNPSSDPIVSEATAHDKRYEEFEEFMASQREFNKKIEKLVTTNSIEIGEHVIDVEDLKQKTKNNVADVRRHYDTKINSNRSEIDDNLKNLTKQVSNLNSKWSTELKMLKNKTSSAGEAIIEILQQLGDIKKQVASSEQSLISQLHHEISSSHSPAAVSRAASPVQSPVQSPQELIEIENRYEVLSAVEAEIIPVATSPPKSPALEEQQPHRPETTDHRQSISTNNQIPQPEVDGPVLMLGDSILRGIQQRKFCPKRFVNKQYVAGGTQEMARHINAMQDRNQYDYILIHTGTNDCSSRLRANAIADNMETCIKMLKSRWPNAKIALSGITYAPKGDNTKIDDVNYLYEEIATSHRIIFINNQIVTSDSFGILDQEVFYDDVHLNNKIGTKKLVANIKLRMGLRREGSFNRDRDSTSSRPQSSYTNPSRPQSHRPQNSYNNNSTSRPQSIYNNPSRSQSTYNNPSRSQSSYKEYNYSTTRPQSRRWDSDARETNYDEMFPPLQALSALTDYFRRHSPR